MFRRLSAPLITVVLLFVLFLTVKPARAAEVDVVWTNIVGVSASGNTLTKTAAAGWGNGGAASTSSRTGDFGIQFTASETNTYRLCGLSDTNADANYTTIDYAVYLVADGTAWVFENGVSRGNFGAYQAGDVFKINRTGTTIIYLKNDTVFYTSTIASSGSLLVDTSLYSTGATISHVKFYGVPAEVPGTITNLNAASSSQTVTLTWSAPSENGSAITGYDVQYGTVASGAFGSTFNDDATPGRPSTA